MFVCETTGELWSENYLNRIHRQVRAAAGLRSELQLQDFRRTGQTEAGAAGATVDEIRSVARHSTREAGEHYVHPDSRFVESAQKKRLALRNKTGKKVRTERNGTKVRMTIVSR